MEKKMNNKGFSLVELIVVIAIMAVLIGVLAPQFIKYVEKSRVSTDVQNVDQIVTAIQTYAAENGFDSMEGTWTLTSDEKNANATAPTKIQPALKDAGLTNKLVLKSQNWTDAQIIVSKATASEPAGVKAVGKNANGQTMANGAE